MTDQPLTADVVQTKALTDWLLQSAIPTIRYKTRTELIGYSADQAVTERAAIMREGPVPVLLAQQLENGAWVNANNYYSPKYKSTHWTLLLLTELAGSL
ncbi:MAG: hypothetical protein KDE19_10825 [Caldilineaceae bacterium]|nr:hypothetical protein [Caldilineaceae bacterium]